MAISLIVVGVEKPMMASRPGLVTDLSPPNDRIALSISASLRITAAPDSAGGSDPTALPDVPRHTTIARHAPPSTDFGFISFARGPPPIRLSEPGRGPSPASSAGRTGPFMANYICR